MCLLRTKMIGIGYPPYQKKSLKTQNRASIPGNVAITGFWPLGAQKTWKSMRWQP